MEDDSLGEGWKDNRVMKGFFSHYLLPTTWLSRDRQGWAGKMG